MWMRSKMLGGISERQRFSDKVNDALALHERSEVRSDSLPLKSMCNRLEIRWRAREVHPWDFCLPTREKESAFLRQLMEDAEVALMRLFERLPEVDEIGLTVLDLQADNVLLSGTVQRSALARPCDRTPSVRIRLAFLGLRLHFDADSVLSSAFEGPETELRRA
jgi:hypothetical protein